MNSVEKQEFIDCLNSAEKLINQKIILITGFISIVAKLSSDPNMKQNCLVSIDSLCEAETKYY